MNYVDALFHVSKDQLKKSKLISELRVFGKETSFGQPVVDCWLEEDDFWLVPIPWAKKQGYKGRDDTPKIVRSWPRAKVGYRHNQKEVVEAAVKHLKKNKCSRVVAPTGYGKSITGLLIAKKLRTNVLVVVPSNEIFKQFITTAEDIFNVDCGVIKGNKAEVDKLVVLTTYQTLARRCVDNPEYLNAFGLFLLDEAHLAGCESIQKILSKVNANWRLSMSADFYRADKLEGVYERYLGEIAATGIKDSTNSMEVVLYAPKLGQKWVDMSKCYDRMGEFSHVKYLNNLAESDAHNQYIADLARRVLALGERRILIGSRRISQSEKIMELLGEDICGMFSGKAKDSELSRVARMPIICYTKSSLGLDMSKFIGDDEKNLDPLNTLILAYPESNSLQLRGRIAREFRGPVGLLIHPVLDDFYSQAKYKACYKKNYQEMTQIQKLEELESWD